MHRLSEVEIEIALKVEILPLEFWEIRTETKAAHA